MLVTYGTSPSSSKRLEPGCCGAAEEEHPARTYIATLACTISVRMAPIPTCNAHGLYTFGLVGFHISSEDAGRLNVWSCIRYIRRALQARGTKCGASKRSNEFRSVRATRARTWSVYSSRRFAIGNYPCLFHG